MTEFTPATIGAPAGTQMRSWVRLNPRSAIWTRSHRLLSWSPWSDT